MLWKERFLCPECGRPVSIRKVRQSRGGYTAHRECIKNFPVSGWDEKVSHFSPAIGMWVREIEPAFAYPHRFSRRERRLLDIRVL